MVVFVSGGSWRWWQLGGKGTKMGGQSGQSVLSPPEQNKRLSTGQPQNKSRIIQTYIEWKQKKIAKMFGPKKKGRKKSGRGETGGNALFSGDICGNNSLSRVLALVRSSNSCQLTPRPDSLAAGSTNPKPGITLCFSYLGTDCYAREHDCPG